MNGAIPQLPLDALMALTDKTLFFSAFCPLPFFSDTRWRGVSEEEMPLFVGQEAGWIPDLL